MRKLSVVLLSLAWVGCIVLCVISDLAAQSSVEDYKKRIEYLSKHPERAKKYIPESSVESVESPDKPLEESTQPPAITDDPCAELPDYLEQCKPYTCQKKNSNTSLGEMITFTVEGFTEQACGYRMAGSTGFEIACSLSDDTRANIAKAIRNQSLAGLYDHIGILMSASEAGECVHYEDGKVVPYEQGEL
ncbi:hypothetical protein ACFL1E_00965 [Candidatus Omnitrophota bacterium]